MAGRTVNMGYLFHIELFKRDCVDGASAISGQELFRHLISIPLAYRKKWAPWFGHDFLNVASGACNVNNKESLDFLVDNCIEFPNFINLACDSKLDYENKRGFFTAKYWLYNVREKGADFYCGIDESIIEANLYLIGDFPLKGITKISKIENDYDLWDYVKTWLDSNWRTPDQIPKKSIQELRRDYLESLKNIQVVHI